MDIQRIVEQLREELAKIERAIEALVGFGSKTAPRRGRPPKAASAPEGEKRTMSAAARKRISEATKQRRAQRKGKPARKKAASRRKPMSPAARKKLSALMKARWAARKRA